MRDAYHDFVTHEQLVDARGQVATSFLVACVREGLARRSGMKSVSNAVVTEYRDSRTNSHQMAVHFDSRAWTGLS